MKQKLMKVRAGLVRSIGDMKTWGAYVDKYFRNKHNFTDDLESILETIATLDEVIVELDRIKSNSEIIDWAVTNFFDRLTRIDGAYHNLSEDHPVVRDGRAVFDLIMTTKKHDKESN